MKRSSPVRGKRLRRVMGWLFLVAGLALLAVICLLLRMGVITDHIYSAAVKDPVRQAPSGRVVVAPADGTVLYIHQFSAGIIPQVVKRGVPIPITDHIKGGGAPPFLDGILIGIYMNTQGVHINRIPVDGTVSNRIIFNGPHMDMTEAEREIILKQLIPGVTTLRKLIGLPPFDLEDKSDFVLESARETLFIDSEAGPDAAVVRIADYYVGKILTWVAVGDPVTRGQKLGMITWGSQTDLFVEQMPEMQIMVEVGDYVYGGETVIAEY
jgi:phosphatidylserine decarboxylase